MGGHLIAGHCIAMNLKKLSATLMLISISAACSSVSNVVEPPKVVVQQVTLQHLSLRETTGLVTLNVTNPNAFTLPLQGVSYHLRLNGVAVASGEQAQNMSLPSQRPVLVEIPVRLQVGEILRLAPMLWRDRQANYQLDGAVRLPMLSVPFQRQGAIGVQQ